MENKIKVLHVVGSMHSGGMENFIMNLFENIDREKFVFDFVVHTENDPAYEGKIEELGGKIYRLPRLTSNPVGNLRGLKKIVRDGKYDFVVRHTPNALVAPQVLVAKKAGAVSVCHSHNTTDPKKVLHKLGKLILKHSKIERFACSEDAGKWMFGNRDFQIIHNAVNIDKFMYSEDNRRAIREEFSGKSNCDTHYYGNIANFIASKNHVFLMDIYAEIAKLDDNAEFFCLGKGDLMEDIKVRATELGIADKVHFTGSRTDANCFMSAFDVLVFPSLFEGLPLTLIEAQAAGLPCLLSDTVTKDVCVTDGLLHYYSLKNAAAQWAAEAYRMATVTGDIPGDNRICQRESISRNGYDINQLCAWYENYFMNNRKVK